MARLFQRWTNRQIDAVDRARVAFFDLASDEEPVEAWPVDVISVWPGGFGHPLRPSDAAKADYSLREGWDGGEPLFFARRLTLSCVLMLTLARLLWCPYRTYKGGLVYLKPVDDVMAEKSKPDSSKAIYTQFPHPSLGQRSVSLDQIQQVDFIVFVPGDLAVLNVYLRDTSGPHQTEYTWPLYDMRAGNDIVDEAESLWEGASSPRHLPFLQISATGPGSLVILTVASAMRFAKVPLNTDFLEDRMQRDWDESPAKFAGWQPMHQRLLARD